MHVSVTASVEAVVDAVGCARFQFFFHVVEREFLPELCRAHVRSYAAQRLEEDGVVVVPGYLLVIFSKSQVIYITALALSDVDDVDAFIVIVQERGKHTLHDFFLHGFNIYFFHELSLRVRYGYFRSYYTSVRVFCKYRDEWSKSDLQMLYFTILLFCFILISTNSFDSLS